MASTNDVQGETSTANAPAFGFWAALAFSVAGIGLSFSGLLPLSTIIGVWPTSNLPVLIGGGVVFGLLLAYTYAMIGSAAPRSGADYVFTSRVLGGRAAFLFSWVFVIFSGLLTGALIIFLVKELIPFGIRQVAILGSVSGLINTADYLQTQQGAALIGTILTLAFFLLALLPPRVTEVALKIGLFLVILAWVLVFLGLIFPYYPFQSAWNQSLGANSFESQLDAARAASLPLLANYGVFSFQTILIGAWLFLGVITPAVLADHFKRPQRTLLGAGLVGVLVSGAIFAAGVLLAQRLINPQWLSAESFLYVNGQINLAMPWLPFYSSVVRPNIWVASFVHLLLVYGVVNFVQVMFMMLSRILMAWAKDQVLPSLFAYSHPLLKTQVINLFVVGVLVQVGVIDAALGGRLSGRFHYAFFAAAALIVPVLASLLFPFRKPAWFRSMGGFVSARVGPIPVISVVSFLSLLGLIAVLVGVWLSGLFSSVRVQALISLVAVAAVGWGVYSLRARYLAQKHIPLAEIFSELPEA